MLFFLLKILISAAIIAVVSEIGKRSSIWAAGLASLPLVSLLSIVWIYLETKEIGRITQFSKDIFWLVIPSLLFFLILPNLLQRGLSFWPSLAASSVATSIAYVIAIKLLN